MSEDKTAEANDSRSFEERALARFDAIENRIERLEMREYDTKPMWEQALTAIVNIRSQLEQINARFDAIDTRFDAVDARFDAVDARFDGVDARFDAVDERFEKIEARLAVLNEDLENGLGGVERKMDVLNQYFLDSRADQRYLDRRLEKLEAKLKPS